MIIFVNDFALNAASNEVYVEQAITGLEIPEIRLSEGNNAGQSGGYSSDEPLYGPRSIGIQGRVFTTTAQLMDQRRRELQRALTSGPITLRILTNGGSAYVVYCKLVDFEMPITRGISSAPYRIELRADDPLIYDDTTGESASVPLYRKDDGGYSFDYLFDYIFASGSEPAIATNTGAVAIYPTLTLTGAMTTPVLTQRTIGQVLSLAVTTGSADTVVIDMRARSVLHNGASVFGTKSGDWWYLQQGENSIELQTASSGDTVTGVIAWRSGYLGI